VAEADRRGWPSGRFSGIVRRMDLAVLRQVIEDYIPFNKFLGVTATSLSRGRVEIEIPFRDELVGDPMKPALHGGVMSMLADVAGGMAIWSTLDDMFHRLSTIDLRVDYLRPGKLESLVAEGTIVRVGRSVGVADVRLFQRSAPADTVATGKGVYAIKSPRPVAPKP
jgi:uncharacterized protein (TIGR00369 family)